MTGLQTSEGVEELVVLDFLGDRKRMGSTFSASSVSKAEALRLMGLERAREGVRFIVPCMYSIVEVGRDQMSVLW